VRLAGRAGNATALGAQIRIGGGDKRGPVRELHGGSGYWSQDSAVAVLPAPAPGAKLWTRWPGGKETVTEIPAGARQVTATAPGSAEN